MFILQNTMMLKPFSSRCIVNGEPDFPCLLRVSPQYTCSNLTFGTRRHWGHVKLSNVSSGRILKSFPCFVVSRNSDSGSNPENSSTFKDKPKKKTSVKNAKASENFDDNPEKIFPSTIPRKARRGRKSEAVAVEDFVRDSLEKTFASIQQLHLDGLETMENVMKDREDEVVDSELSDVDHEDREEEEKEEEEEEDDDENVTRINGKRRKMVVQEESRNWPLDADVGWGIRASEYFEQHAIKNTVGEDGVEIDWEGEIDNNWVKEINCLEWESFAFHPSPLIVLVFERYNRATDNWKTLKELEKAAKVYWSAKDRLPPRTVKIDMNIERDLAYALKANGSPQILFLRGNRILYREKEFRTADELVQMIAHFYYNAKKPSCIKD